MPATSISLIDRLRFHATHRGEQTALRFLRRGETVEDTATYADLDRSARRVAGNLLQGGFAGRPVVIALPQGLDFVRIFLGCLYAGAIAVPAPALADPRGAERILGIAANARAAALVAPGMRLTPSTTAPIHAAVPTLAFLDAADLLSGDPAEMKASIAPDQIAFLQYTSGSTSRPKGVVVTHANIDANLAMIRTAFGQDETSSAVSWLPLHHDMGLIGCVLEPLNLGACATLMSPLAFLQKPMRWLAAMDAFGATTAGAPNFGYEMVARAATDADVRGLDLSRWRLAFCGSEPVRATTLRRFATRFAPAGFDAGALYPCYGLAEATLFVTGGAPGRGLVDATIEHAHGTSVAVGCGRPWLGCDVALVRQESDERVASGEIGEIAVAGPQVSPGFWSGDGSVLPDPARRVQLGRRAYLRTGDLGTFRDGDLFVVGRLKDMIIVRGANIYAEDVEATMAGHPGVAGAVAALARTGRFDGNDGGSAGDSFQSFAPRESFAVVVEAGREAKDPEPDLAGLAQRIAEAHGVMPSQVMLCPAGTIARTLSGKLQRAATRARLDAGALPILDCYVPPILQTGAASHHSKKERVADGAHG